MLCRRLLTTSLRRCIQVRAPSDDPLAPIPDPEPVPAALSSLSHGDDDDDAPRSNSGPFDMQSSNNSYNPDDYDPTFGLAAGPVASAPPIAAGVQADGLAFSERMRLIAAMHPDPDYVPSAPPTSAADTNVEALVSWFSRNGIRTHGIDVAWDRVRGLGLIASESIPEGTFIAAVPVRLVLSTRSSRIGNTFSSAIEAQLRRLAYTPRGMLTESERDVLEMLNADPATGGFQSRTMHRLLPVVDLAVYILKSRRRETPFHTWASTLPTHLPGFFATGPQVAALPGAPVLKEVDRVLAFGASYRVVFDILWEALPLALKAEHSLTRGEFAWAMVTAMSRADAGFAWSAAQKQAVRDPTAPSVDSGMSADQHLEKARLDDLREKEQQRFAGNSASLVDAIANTRGASAEGDRPDDGSVEVIPFWDLVNAPSHDEQQPNADVGDFVFTTDDVEKVAGYLVDPRSADAGDMAMRRERAAELEREEDEAAAAREAKMRAAGVPVNPRAEEAPREHPSGGGNPYTALFGGTPQDAAADERPPAMEEDSADTLENARRTSQFTIFDRTNRSLKRSLELGWASYRGSYQLVRTMRPIAAGEEITTTYVPVRQDIHRALSALRYSFYPTRRPTRGMPMPVRVDAAR
eukprot:TRINITY_DN8344_c0_g1_i1.p1 TRINITY_DN8344_c0_g1~~TRINITY_DN8344_c0_g1_i1.p1  ORF type:complete len:637 (-),score=143.43 TRINITY_DN8344_c0_g1_i1:268-2178(-)